MRKTRWFHIVSIVFLVLIIVPLSPVYPANICESSEKQTLVALTFDDGYSSWTSVIMPTLKSYDLPATAFINPPERRGEELTWANVYALQDAGWEIGWHTVMHHDVDNMERDELIKDCESAMAIFREHELPAPVSFAYPRGHHDQDSRDIISQYFLYAKTAKIGVNTPCSIHANRVRLTTQLLLSELPYLQKEIIRYGQEGVLFVITGHMVGQVASGQDKTEMSVDDFKDLAAFLHQKKQEGIIDVVTFAEGVRRMQQREYSSHLGLKIESPFRTWFRIGFVIFPGRYKALHDWIVWDFIGNHNAEIAHAVARIFFGPKHVGLYFVFGMIIFIVITIVITITQFIKNRKNKNHQGRYLQ